MPSKKAENRARFGKNSEDALTEWEKNQIRPIFRDLLQGRKGISKEDCIAIMPMLANDDCVIGKVPNLREDEYDSQFEGWPFNEEGLITWHFYAENCNSWPWRMMEASRLQANIDDFFAKAHKLKMQGKEAESREMASKALRLQGSLSRAKPIELEQPKKEAPSKRGDTFFRKVLRREDNVPMEDALDHTKTLDKTQTHKFRV